jgi:hypothetical protein
MLLSIPLLSIIHENMVTQELLTSGNFPKHIRSRCALKGKRNLPAIFALCFIIVLLQSTVCKAQLIKASRKGDIKEVERLIDAGADLNERGTAGVTPLYWAVQENEFEIARLLIYKGADVNLGLTNDWKPLHLAIKNQNAEMVKLLLDNGADMNALNASDKSPEQLAQEGGSTAIISLLKEAEYKKYAHIDSKNEKITPVVKDEPAKFSPSDVDVDIPVYGSVKTNTYALIIGNEDYSSFQTGLSTEVNVDYAVNDARVFKDYCKKTMGIPEKQIKLLTNATYGQMNQGIAWLSNLAGIDEGNAELIFYYSGHGLPDEETKEPYLIPVDISGSNVTQGIKLADVYTKLNEYPSQRITAFLDACFSGGSRNQGLVAMKGVKVKPKENLIMGNMVVLSSSTGTESSGVYREKQHGYMTYFMLKALQESEGNITYKELADRVIDNVKKETALNGKIQTPQLNYSQGVEDVWPDWKIR